MASYRTQEETIMWQSLSGKVKDLIMQYRHLDRSVDRKEEERVAAINYVEAMMDDSKGRFGCSQESSNQNTFVQMNKVRDEIAKIICNRSEKEISFVGKEMGVNISIYCNSYKNFNKSNGVMSTEAALQSLDKFIKKSEPVQKPQSSKKGGKISLSEFLGESTNSVKVSTPAPVSSVSVSAKPSASVSVQSKTRQPQSQGQGRWSNLM